MCVCLPLASRLTLPISSLLPPPLLRLRLLLSSLMSSTSVGMNRSRVDRRRAGLGDALLQAGQLLRQSLLVGDEPLLWRPHLLLQLLLEVLLLERGQREGRLNGVPKTQTGKKIYSHIRA